MKSSIMKDNVTLEQFHKLNYAVSCEDCSHFDAKPEICTLGYPVEPHLRRNQIKDIETNGLLAFCRTQEID